MQQMDESGQGHIVRAALRLQGALDCNALEASINALCARHEVLRTKYQVVGDQPQQFVQSTAACALNYTDLTDTAGDHRLENATQLAAEDASRPFDLVNGQLFRFHLYRLAESDHLFVFACHHVAMDGTSIAIVLRDLSALYTAFKCKTVATLPKLSVRY